MLRYYCFPINYYVLHLVGSSFTYFPWFVYFHVFLDLLLFSPPVYTPRYVARFLAMLFITIEKVLNTLTV